MYTLCTICKKAKKAIYIKYVQELTLVTALVTAVAVITLVQRAFELRLRLAFFCFYKMQILRLSSVKCCRRIHKLCTIFTICKLYTICKTCKLCQWYIPIIPSFITVAFLLKKTITCWYSRRYQPLRVSKMQKKSQKCKWCSLWNGLYYWA